MEKSLDIKTLEKASDGPETPFILFDEWYEQAKSSEPVDPNAMCLSTLSEDGQPTSRIVLLKQHDESGFVFFTNRESRKGQNIKYNPLASLNFYWKSLGRQIRIEGKTEEIDAFDSDEYYKSRHTGSRIGAWASKQSRPLSSRSELAEQVEKYTKDFKESDDIPRPGFWGGYRVVPNRIEFWHEGEFRLHTRLVYTRSEQNTSWDREMLYP